MNTIQFKIIGTGLVFIVIFLSGFWLSRNGAPYGTGLVTLHKLIALGVFVFLVVTMVQVNKAVGLSNLEWALGIVTAVLFIGTIIMGGLITTNLILPAVVRTLHHITPYLTMISTVATLFLLLNHVQQVPQ